ncbi:MAG TPA: tetratricopeptide repeat protein, partial [Myxococcaceae bacterium]|nr:tetratricopeptide repeat protein [Myxococcaceae bacterium]
MHLTTVACVLLAPAAAASDPLAFGAALDEVIWQGEVRHVEIEATSGTAMHLQLDHPHLEMGLRVVDPGGRTLGEVENVLKRTDPLTLTVVVKDSGPHRLQVWLRPHAHGGRYRISLGAASPATERDRLRLEAQQLRGEADAVFAAQDGAHYPHALGNYDRATALWVQAGDEAQRAETLTRKGELLRAMARLPEARSTLDEALRSWRAAGDRAREVDCLAFLGLVTTELGDPREAVALLEQALAARRGLAPLPVAEAKILDFLGVALGNLGDLPGAVERYTGALAHAREDRDPGLVATVLMDRALDLDRLGEAEQALADLGEARDIFRTLGNPGDEGNSEYGLGLVLQHMGRAREAWSAYSRALPLLERSGDVRFVAFTLNHLGLLRLEAGRPDEARPLFQQALERLQAAGDRRSAIHMRVNIARSLTESGRAAEALQPLAAGRAELHAIGDRLHEATALTELARAELATGLLLDARRHVLEALHLTEELRGSIAGPSARAGYGALFHDRYELLVSVLMAMHARQPESGWDAAALEASESARARALLEVLAAARVDLERDVNPGLRAEARQLEERNERARRSLVEVLGRQHRPEEADAVERELTSLRIERERIRERMRAASPRYAALAPARPLSVEEIRSEVLDDTSALVEYMVGERQSFVWVVSRSGLRSATLPGRHAIEQAVTALHRRWSDPHAVDDGGALARALSRMVLGPVADALAARSLVVVADGALQQIPFAALPVPGRSTTLIDRHTVVSSPSASVLPALGTPRPGPTAGPELAILADPVLAQQPGVSSALMRSMEDTGLRALEPLPGARREASAIAARLPADRVVR